ncbi:hypothetical protein ACLG6S_09220 [Thermodesulfobacteriota bacterium B35]
MERQEVAVLYSGGRDSLSIYALAATGLDPLLGRPERIHLLHMLNGMGRFPAFPATRLETATKILAAQAPAGAKPPETEYVELDCGRLFQGLWLDHYEELMPRFDGKNLVCVACKLAMHARAVIYCVRHRVPVLTAGYTLRQDYYPEQTPAFMERIAAMADRFGIATRFPVYEAFDSEDVTRHLLEDLGLPSTGGGERKCLFCQTKTTARPEQIGRYLDEMIPRVCDYIDHRLAGRIREAALCFPPGR